VAVRSRPRRTLSEQRVMRTRGTSRRFEEKSRSEGEDIQKRGKNHQRERLRGRGVEQKCLQSRDFNFIKKSDLGKRCDLGGIGDGGKIGRVRKNAALTAKVTSSLRSRIGE